MTITVGLVVEIAFNLIQQLMFIGFLYLFFDKGENKIKNILAFWISVLLLFTMANYFTFNEMTLNHLDSIITIVVMLVYSIFFLKGELYLRIIIPIIAFGLNMLISYLNLFVMSTFGDVPFVEAITFSSSFRYMYLTVANLLYLVALLIILRIGKRKIQVVSKVEIIAFIIVAAALYTGSLSTMIFYKQLINNEELTPYIIIVLVSLFVSAGVFWFLLLKISKDNQVKTDLLLSRQREEMYRESVISSSEQIRLVSEIKHDMKNNLSSIYSLIDNGQYDDAKRLCLDCSDSIAKVYTPINTDNPTLNAILNVEIEKARQIDISFSYTVTDSLDFVSATDVVSIIGNLCDNAIEYLSAIDKSQRKMSLEITVKNDYRIIMCRNTILSSVLSVNPDMKTTKNDETLHGKGLSILRSIAEKYNGTLSYQEDDDSLEVTLVIKDIK